MPPPLIDASGAFLLGCLTSTQRLAAVPVGDVVGRNRCADSAGKRPR